METVTKDQMMEQYKAALTLSSSKDEWSRGIFASDHVLESLNRSPLTHDADDLETETFEAINTTVYAVMERLRAEEIISGRAAIRPIKAFDTVNNAKYFRAGANQNPVILEVVVNGANTLDLCDVANMMGLEKFYKTFKREYKDKLNNILDAELDDVLIREYIKSLRVKGKMISMVRQICYGGKPLYKNSEIKAYSHIKYVIIDAYCISKISILK